VQVVNEHEHWAIGVQLREEWHSVTDVDDQVRPT
jgi:hypothetical protein